MRAVLSAAELPQVLLDIVLGLLLFAASLHVDLTELRREKWIVLILATASVIIATLVFGAGIWIVFRVAGTPVPLGWCMVLGSGAGTDRRSRGRCAVAQGPAAFSS